MAFRPDAPTGDGAPQKEGDKSILARLARFVRGPQKPLDAAEPDPATAQAPAPELAGQPTELTKEQADDIFKQWGGRGEGADQKSLDELHAKDPDAYLDQARRLARTMAGERAGSETDTEQEVPRGGRRAKTEAKRPSAETQVEALQRAQVIVGEKQRLSEQGLEQRNVTPETSKKFGEFFKSDYAKIQAGKIIISAAIVGGMFLIGGPLAGFPALYGALGARGGELLSRAALYFNPNGKEHSLRQEMAATQGEFHNLMGQLEQLHVRGEGESDHAKNLEQLLAQKAKEAEELANEAKELKEMHRSKAAIIGMVAGLATGLGGGLVHLLKGISVDLNADSVEHITKIAGKGFEWFAAGPNPTFIGPSPTDVGFHDFGSTWQKGAEATWSIMSRFVPGALAGALIPWHARLADKTNRERGLTPANYAEHAHDFEPAQPAASVDNNPPGGGGAGAGAPVETATQASAKQEIRIKDKRMATPEEVRWLNEMQKSKKEADESRAAGLEEMKGKEPSGFPALTDPRFEKMSLEDIRADILERMGIKPEKGVTNEKFADKLSSWVSSASADDLKAFEKFFADNALDLQIKDQFRDQMLTSEQYGAIEEAMKEREKALEAGEQSAETDNEDSDEAPTEVPNKTAATDDELIARGRKKWEAEVAARKNVRAAAETKAAEEKRGGKTAQEARQDRRREKAMKRPEAAGFALDKNEEKPKPPQDPPVEAGAAKSPPAPQPEKMRTEARRFEPFTVVSGKDALGLNRLDTPQKLFKEIYKRILGVDKDAEKNEKVYFKEMNDWIANKATPEEIHSFIEFLNKSKEAYDEQDENSENYAKYKRSLGIKVFSQSSYEKLREQS